MISHFSGWRREGIEATYAMKRAPPRVNAPEEVEGILKKTEPAMIETPIAVP